MINNKTNKHLHTAILLFSLLVPSAGFMPYTITANASRPFLFFGKKKKKDNPPVETKYKQLTGQDSVKMTGLMNVIHKGDN